MLSAKSKKILSEPSAFVPSNGNCSSFNVILDTMRQFWLHGSQLFVWLLSVCTKAFFRTHLNQPLTQGQERPTVRCL